MPPPPVPPPRARPPDAASSTCRVADRDLPADQLAAAQDEEQHQGDGEVEEEAAEEDRQRAVRQPLVLRRSSFTVTP